MESKIYKYKITLSNGDSYDFDVQGGITVNRDGSIHLIKSAQLIGHEADCNNDYEMVAKEDGE